MNCPVCKTKLKRSRYEGVVIRHCVGCEGTLVSFERLKNIQSRRDQSEDALIDELANAVEDNLERVRCPNCLSTMAKQRKSIGKKSHFSTDRCKACRLIWLDRGELAKLQVLYEFSEKGEEALWFQQRLANMTPEEKQEYENRIANLRVQNLGAEVVAGVLKNLSGRAALSFLDLLDPF